MIELKTKEEIELMRESSRIVAELHDLLKKHIEPGITTLELDQISYDYVTKKKAIPAFKGYKGYPATICTSVNEQIVHGIPSGRKLKDGDIVSIDIGVIYRDFCGDAAATYPVGKISSDAGRLLEVTEKSLYEGIEKAVVGARLSNISNAIQTYVEKEGLSVVRDFVGHGIGRKMHEDPQIPNFGPPLRGILLEQGMALAIEPMVNAGSYEAEVMEDGWTAVTKDNSLSAHFEHTIAITENGPDILSKI